MWYALLATQADLGLFVVAWWLTERWQPPLRTRAGQLIFGLLLGLTVILMMSMAVEVLPGFKFDLRHSLIAASGLFGGPIAAGLTGLMAAGARLVMGGAGVIPGVVGIAIAVAIGSIGYWLSKRKTYRLPGFTLFAAAVTVGTLLSFLSISPDMRYDLLGSIGVPLVTLTFLGTLVAVLLVDMEIRRREVHRTNLIYRAMVQELPDCLNAKDLSGRFLVANDATARLMRASSAEELIGRTDFDFYPEPLAKAYRDEETSILKGGMARHIDQRVAFADGEERWLSTVKAPLHNRDGDVVGLISHNRDVTAIHEVQARREEFVSTVSHELRSPVAAIKGSLNLLVSGMAGDLPETATRLLNAANRSTQRLAELIDDILDIEKLETGNMDFEPQPLEARQIVDEVLDTILHYMPEKGIAWSVTETAEGAVLLANPNRLRQILTNLMSNAVKFSPENGCCVVEVSASDGCIDIAVRDQGPGVPPEFESRLFQKFAQDEGLARKAGKSGTGLGLNIAKAMVERMSGRISYSRLDGMTEFRISLPDDRSGIATLAAE